MRKLKEDLFLILIQEQSEVIQHVLRSFLGTLLPKRFDKQNTKMP